MSKQTKKPKLSDKAAVLLRPEFERAKAVTASAKEFAAEVMELSTDFLAQNLIADQYKVDYKKDSDGRISVTPMAVEIEFAAGQKLEVTFDPASKAAAVLHGGNEIFSVNLNKPTAGEELRDVVVRQLSSEVDLIGKLKAEVNGPNTKHISAAAKAGLTPPKA
jgi:hypothetical protein